MNLFKWIKRNFLGLLALLVAVLALAWQVARDCLFDPKLQELKHNPKLTGRQWEFECSENHKYVAIELRNDGLLAAKNVKVIFQGEVGVHLPDQFTVHVTPPCPIAAEKQGNAIIVTTRPPDWKTRHCASRSRKSSGSPAAPKIRPRASFCFLGRRWGLGQA